MPSRPLPPDPSHEHLRKEANRLRNAVRAGSAEALAHVRAFHPRPDQALDSLPLADAQLVTARSYGFPSWTKLTRHLAEIEPFIWTPPADPDPASRDDVFIRFACLTYLGRIAPIRRALRCDSVERVAAMLEEDPALANARDEQGAPLVFDLHPELERVEEMVGVLVAHGADLDARNLQGTTLLDAAVARGLKDLADVLRRHGARGGV